MSDNITDAVIAFAQKGLDSLKDNPAAQTIVFRFCFGATNWAIPENKGANRLLAAMDIDGRLGNGRSGGGEYLGHAVLNLFQRAQQEVRGELSVLQHPTIIRKQDYSGGSGYDVVRTLRVPARKKRAAEIAKLKK